MPFCVPNLSNPVHVQILFKNNLVGIFASFERDQMSTLSQILTEAALIEQQAMAFDRTGQVQSAVQAYNTALAKFSEGISLIPLNHPDAIPIEHHVAEIQNRVSYLLSLPESARPLIPLESHISPVQLTVETSPELSSTQTMGTAAAIGGVGGLLLLGPLGLIAGAAGAAYAATRDDDIGVTTRGVAQKSYTVVDKVREVDREHQISATAKSMGSAAVAKVSEIDQKYEVTETVKAAGSEAARRLSAFNERYKITDSISNGISSGVASLSSFIRSGQSTPQEQQGRTF